MTPRAAAQTMIERIKQTMAAEWQNLAQDFEPETRADVKAIVWVYVARHFLKMDKEAGD